MRSMKHTLTVLVLLLTLVHGAASAAPFIYCFSGGSLCCDSFGDDCCETVKAADEARPGTIHPDHPELTNGCNGTLLLSAPRAISTPGTKFALVHATTVHETPVFFSPAKAPVLGPLTQLLQFPHLSSVVLRI
jgi:hypothetical protein